MSKLCCSMYNMADDGEYIWFWAFRENMLCRMKKGTLIVNPIARFKARGILATEVWGQHKEVYYCSGKLVLPPCGHNAIKIIDISNFEIRELDMPQRSFEGFTPLIFGKAYNNDLYFVSHEADGLYKLSIGEENNINPIWINDTPTLSWGSACFNDDGIKFTSLSNNIIYNYDIGSGEISKESVQGLEQLAGIVDYNGKTLIIPQKTDRIICFENGESKPVILKQFPKDYECGEWSFYKLTVIDDFLYLLPRDANMILVINMNDFTIKPIDIKNINRKTLINKYMPISHVWKVNNDVVGIASESGDIINLTGDEKYEFVIEGTPIIEELDDVEGRIILEKNNYYNSLEGFIANVVRA